MLNILLPLAAEPASSGGLGKLTSSQLMPIVLIGVLGVGMYFFSIRPQKKRQKEEQALRDNVNVGDEITTIGGIMGRVVTVKDEDLVIETGADRNKMKIAKWAVQTNNTAVDKLKEERAAAAEAKKSEADARQSELEGQGKVKKGLFGKKNKTED